MLKATQKKNTLLMEMEKTREELQEELKKLQRVFYFLNEIKDIDNGKRIQLEQELEIAFQEIAIQNEEKEKRAAELIIANLELKFQSEEKAKRAAELVIANIELIFQNKEKEKRAAELIVANKELIFQNEEKEKRAAELTIANKELIFQNKEKEKRAAELIIANKELIFQNEEKLKRAAELILAKEIAEEFEEKFKQIAEFPILDESGKIIKRAGIARDITERYKNMQELVNAMEKAEKSDRLKSAFLANMSHEIRTPMNGILGFAELLKKPDLTGDEQQEYIKIIAKSGLRMLNIINNIVDISKIESGLMEVNPKLSNIIQQMEYVYTFFKPETESKKLKLELKNTLSAKEAIITTDSEKIYAILINLVKNAIKYTNEGSIVFGCDKKGDNLEFFVKDTGIGIPAERQEAIFERFIQADISDIHALQGSGLGLTISKAYVELLGGRIWLESNPDSHREGIGSTFKFTIPYSTETEEKNVNNGFVPDDETNLDIKNLKILIAEDDETSEMLITIHVEKFGKEILTAKNGFEAVEVCRNNPDTDLILMDIQMPVMNGYDATRQIRQFNEDVVIIAQTAFGLSGDREKAIVAGCNNYISKPIDNNKLQLLIQKYFTK